jgi:DNA-binding MarR family transcriptional regulator
MAANNNRTTRRRRPAPSEADLIAAVTARAGYMMGDQADQWPPTQAAAWEGFLELSRRLRRDAEALVEERHQLSISMLGIMGRLARAPKHTLRQTDLADAMGLSLSRISRIIDILEQHQLVTRHTCPTDARATNVKLTRAGHRRTTTAQTTLHAYVRQAFLDQLTDQETTTLATLLTRLITRWPTGTEGTAAACDDLRDRP